MSIKKTRLNVEFNYDFILFGLSSSVKFFKLAWAINRQLHLQLVRQPDHMITLKNSSEANFGIYTWQSETGVIELFKNKSLDKEGQYLVPEFNHFDYLIRVDSALQSFSKEEILKELRDVPWIEYIAALDVKNLKSKDNFLS
ncbi:MAG: IPExxxVDY family protein [Bacteroidota bacterium]